MSSELYFVVVSCECSEGLHAHMIRADSAQGAMAEIVKQFPQTQGKVMAAFLSPPAPSCPKARLKECGHDGIQGFMNVFQKLYSGGFRHGLEHARRESAAAELIDRGWEPPEDQVDDTEVEIKP